MSNWQFYVNRRFNYFVEWVQIVCTKSGVQKGSFGFSFPLRNYLILNGDEYYWLPDADSYKEFLDKRYRKDKKFFSKFIKAEFRVAEDAQKAEKSLKKLAPKLAKMSDRELLAAYEKFLDAYIRCFATAFVRPDDYLEMKVKGKIAGFLRQSRKKGNVDEIFKKVATYPKIGNKKLDYLEEPLDLLKIAKVIKDKNESIDNLSAGSRQKIVKHWQKYQWLKNPNAFENLSVSKEELAERLSAQLKENIGAKIGHITRTRKEDEREFLFLVGSFSFSRELRNFMDDLRKFIFLRTYTTESADRLFYWARQTILAEVAERMSVGSEDVIALTGDEIINFLKKQKRPLLSDIRSRKKTFALLWQNGKAFIGCGKEAEKLIDEYKGLRSTAVQKEDRPSLIKGQAASLGKAVGKVKILRSYEEVNKFERGDILVVSMTTPDYITAMEKAAAFVTDEGGITCHAAIVSREMNKPCIIGTKVATKVLKDGDLVEVDADKGVVEILKNK